MQSAMSDEADALYRPLGGVEEWAAGVEIDASAFAQAVARVRAATGDAADLARRGALLAFAHRSAALDSVDAADGAQVRANYEALLLAGDVEVSEPAIRRIHQVACRAQLTHPVLVDGHVQDHVMAAGDYKHHPNHVLLDSGEWRATAPVALVRSEMARLVDAARGAAFAGLHPLAQAGYVHDALVHVQPFADGNGRVARALAGGRVLRVAPVPPLIGGGAGAAGLLQAFLDAVDRFETACADPDARALARWRVDSEVGRGLRSALGPAVERALARYMSRAPSDRRADLSSVAVQPGPPLLIRAPAGVEEVIGVDAHPLGGGPVTARAREAGLAVEAGQPLDPWLDRVVSALALRVAAELED